MGGSIARHIVRQVVLLDLRKTRVVSSASDGCPEPVLVKPPVVCRKSAKAACFTCFQSRSRLSAERVLQSDCDVHICEFS